MREWFVYMVAACDGTLYTGISTDVQRRFAEHCAGKSGARFFRMRKPRELVFVEGGHDRSSASKREMQIKKLTRRQKLQLVNA